MARNGNIVHFSFINISGHTYNAVSKALVGWVDRYSTELQAFALLSSSCVCITECNMDTINKNYNTRREVTQRHVCRSHFPLNSFFSLKDHETMATVVSPTSRFSTLLLHDNQQPERSLTNEMTACLCSQSGTVSTEASLPAKMCLRLVGHNS